MIKREGLIYRAQGKRTLILRDNSNEREEKNCPKANYNGTGLALVGITRKYETPEALIDRINGMRRHFIREADSAFSLFNKERNKRYKQEKDINNK